MNIFVVTSGEFSEYRIKAIFSTRELAEDYIKSEGGSIKEWDVDVLDIDHHYITIKMCKNGKLINEPYHFISREPYTSFAGYWSNKLNDKEPRFIQCIIETGSEERAIKVVNEKRIQLLANGWWGDYEKTEQLFSDE